VSAGTPPAPRAYLDYAGFAPVDPRVLAIMRPFLEAGIGNPSAPHSLGTEAREALDTARVKVARLVGGAVSGVLFTSGATEANNLAVRGVVTAGRDPAAAHVVMSAIEHISVVNACRDLERIGARVTVVPVDELGQVDPDDVRRALSPDTALVSVAAASLEVGTLAPLAEIAQVTRRAGVPLHVDAVGALGRVPLAAEGLGVDLLTLSGNDLYGPPGIGALWVRPGVRLRAQLMGGGQEAGYRSGTENLPGIVGLGVAADLMRVDAGHGEPDRLAALRDRLLDGLVTGIPHCRPSGSRQRRLPQHASVLLRGVKADGVLLDLDLAGVTASTGSACGTLTGMPSATLRAMGVRADEVQGALCMTLGRWSGAVDVEAVLDRLPAIVARLRSLSPAAS
jgi:cysteine desulfurase